MGEKCDPHIYYQRVRLPMSGWRNNPALPQGLVYETQFGGQVRPGPKWMGGPAARNQGEGRVGCWVGKGAGL